MAISLPGAGDEEDCDGVLSMINTTPLVDVMLVLLIIFLITIPVVVSSVPVALPKAEAAPAHLDKDSVVLSVDQEGKTYWNGQPLTGPAELTARLAALPPAKPMIQVRGDADARFEAVAAVIAACRAVGLSRLGFATEPPPP